MKLSDVDALIVKAMNEGAKHKPELMCGLGVGMMLAATIKGISKTPEAMRRLEEKKKELKKDKLSVVETVVTAGSCYISTGVLMVAGAGCVIGGQKESLKRNAALATAYSLTETAFSDYKAKVVETIGKEKERVVQKDADAKAVKDNPPTKDNVIITGGKGEVLCYEPTSSRYFYGNIEKIRSAINDLNRQMYLDTYISLNEYYYAIGLAETTIGEDLGWHVDKGFIEMRFTSTLTKDNEPAIVLGFDNPPQYRWEYQ